MKRSSVVTTMPYIESNFNGMKHLAGCQSRPTKGRQFYHFYHSQQRRAIKCKMVDFTAIKEIISPKTLSKFTFALLVLWIVLGGILCVAFSEMQINESRYDFRCDGIGDTRNIDFIRANCYQQYWMQNHKHGIPPYAFMLLNVALIPIVTCIYSLCVKTTVNKLERLHRDDGTEPRDRRRSLFIAYLCHLVVNIALEITFFTLLETHLFYPKNFPSHFPCSVKNHSVNRTQSTNLFNCNTARAGEKNVWITLAEVINGVFAFCAFVEIICILSRARNSKKFTENHQFYFHHLESNSQEVRQHQPEATPLVININTRDYAERPEKTDKKMSSKHLEHVQGQNDFESAIQILKENCLQGTQQPSDLKQPFHRPQHGQGHKHDLKMDEIYVHVAIHEGRAEQYFAKDLDRRKELKEYPPDEKDCQFAKPEDIIDVEHKNVLVVGRPGIGKTSLSTKMLRLWASGEAFNRDALVFNVVFLVKFRRFNDNAELSLRDLLTRAETVQCLDDSVFEFVLTDPAKVLLIFDGLDEYSRREDISVQEDDPTDKNNVEQKMPFPVLYYKLATGKLLPGASILTTTRPKAVECVENVTFERTVEIRGFTSQNVEDYVQKFCQDSTGAKEKIWEHIKSNTNLFSLCYIPVNCFLVCHCLLHIFLSRSSQPLPKKITDIYKMTVKMVFFNHNRESCSPEKLGKLKEKHMYDSFEKFPEELQELLYRLGEIAFKGIKEGRLLFESSEVSRLEDCGLLHKLPDLKPKALGDPPKSQFCFTHLTVQEFFAAKHLVDNKCEKKRKIERFVRKHINNGTWEVVLQFVAGLLKGSSSDIFIKLLPKSTDKKRNRESPEPKTLTFWPATEKDKYLAVQVCKCLYEINDKQLPVLQNKIEKIKFNAVDFSFCSLAPTDVAAVSHFLENAEEVLYIDLSINALGDLSANEVKKFIVNRERKLKRLDLSGNNLTDNAAKDLGEALKHSNCKLKSLDLWSNKLTDNAAKNLGEAFKHSNCKLESLVLWSNELTDNAAKDLGEALKHSNCKLESLDLGRNNLTDNAAKDLGEALMHSNCKLESLYLSYNKLTDNAAKDLGEALKHSNCKLESLDLSENKLTDNAAKDLGEALKHSNCKLESLDLMGNNFTKAGKKYLTDAGKQSNCKVFV